MKRKVQQNISCMRKFLTHAFFLLWIIAPSMVRGQKFMGITMKDPVICYGHTQDHPHYIPAPGEYVRWKNGARTKTANIQVNYNGFTPAAMQAFQYAVDIWATLIQSSQTITIDAYWVPLSGGVLGGALYTSAFANFDGAQKLNVFYPVALAEKMSGRNLNGNNSEIFTQFNSNANWHLDPMSPPPSGTFDLATVVLHEIGHGLGFSGSFKILTTGQGEVGLQTTGIPIIYDVPIENGSAQNLIQTFASPSSQLTSQLISDNLFFRSPNSGRPKIYAPSSFSSGSSISHLDENTFNGTPDALMTPFIGQQERMHNPGVAWNMLKDLGWENVYIRHTPLPNTEDLLGPYIITASFEADNDYQASSVKLNYTTDGVNFTSVTMTPTGNPHEFTASIPSTGVTTTYGYYISVNDNNNRQFVKPGKIVRKQNTELQFLYLFEAGPDTRPPKITHSPRPFLTESDTEVLIDAYVSDNIGIASVILEYEINGSPQPPLNFTLQSPGEDSIYHAVIDLGTGLQDGDVVRYRIVATDNSSNSNQAKLPASEFFTLNVVGLAPTQDSYANDFNTPTNDFFGNGFSITTPAGFTDPAIHSEHPYPEGYSFPGGEFNFIYQLRVPIRVKAIDATLKFDEIVLVEPGEPGSVFGDQRFWDYVVVEGSKDGGQTWVPVAPGYDSRDYTPWLMRYNSSIVGNNSTAVGDPSLFRTRVMDLQNRFDTGDEVVIRFRLYSDPYAAGWGWCIDNLKIQIDETPPKILHNHIDYLKDADDVLFLSASVSDASGVESFKLQYRVNNGTLNEEIFDVDPPKSFYNFSLSGLAALSPGDFIEYRYIATDSAGNTATLPASGFFKVPIVNFSAPVTTYTNNFNGTVTDFVGNFFGVSQPSGFTSGAIHTEHPYPNGFGINVDESSNYTFTLLKPVVISSSNPVMRFDEIVIVEPASSGATFGTPAFKDYVIVEGSKDGGTTWLPFLNGYNARIRPEWLNAFNNSITPTPALFRTRLINLTANGNFSAGETVLIRFRLFANNSVNGWGWAIDNLFIQDAITSVELTPSAEIDLYPNPFSSQFTVETTDSGPVVVSMNNIQGQQLFSAEYENPAERPIIIQTKHLPAGLYIVRVQTSRGVVTKKLIKVD